MIYKLIRRVHLYSALVLGAFLLLYAGTAFFIFTSDWYPDNEAVTVVQGVGAFTPPTGSEWATNREAARAVEEQYRVQYGIHGRFQTFARHNDGRFDVVYRRPGAETRVRFFAGSDSLNVITKKYGFNRLMNRVHNFRWYEGGPAYQIWALFMDLASLAMILYAVSGIWLWYTLKVHNRSLGWIVLGSGALYTMGSIVHLMVAR
jgi:hypothetical protein